MAKDNYAKRSAARGVGARGANHTPNAGGDAYKQAKRSKQGHYRVEFTKTYDQMTEKDVENRYIYGLDLISDNIRVPSDLLILDTKKATKTQTLTALDEVFYVKLGVDIVGKLSIRTQRHWKGTRVHYIFQIKKTALKPPRKSYSRKAGYGKRTTSQKGQARRKSHNTKGKRSY